MDGLASIGTVLHSEAGPYTVWIWVKPRHYPGIPGVDVGRYPAGDVGRCEAPGLSSGAGGLVRRGFQIRTLPACRRGGQAPCLVALPYAR